MSSFGQLWRKLLIENLISSEWKLDVYPWPNIDAVTQQDQLANYSWTFRLWYYCCLPTVSVTQLIETSSHKIGRFDLIFFIDLWISFWWCKFLECFKCEHNVKIFYSPSILCRFYIWSWTWFKCSWQYQVHWQSIPNVISI